MKNLHSSLEALETRIAPASINAAGTVLTYTDIDGDLVKITFTKVKVTDANFTFSTGTATDGVDTARTLDKINLIGAAGAGFTLTATPKGGKGDSHANIGEIDALATNLGTVSVDGDVNRVTAGSIADTVVGIKSFTALSMGRTNFTSAPVFSEVKSAGSFVVKNAATDVRLTFLGNVQTLSIGGNFGDLIANGSDINIAGNVGTLKIGGSVLARDTSHGSIKIGGTTGSFTLGGSLFGATSGSVTDFQVDLGTSAKTITIGGDLQGKAAQGGGSLLVGSAGTIKIGGSLHGGVGTNTASLVVLTAAKSLSIGGDVRGFAGANTNQGLNGGSIVVDTIGSVRIGGSMIGTAAAGGSGSYTGGSVGSFTIGHNLISNTPTGNFLDGVILLSGNLGSLKIGGDIIVGSPSSTNYEPVISVGGVIGSMSVGGSILGSTNHPATILAGGLGAAEGAAAIKSLSVKHDVRLASIVASYRWSTGSFLTANTGTGIGKVTIGGDLVASQVMAGTTPSSDGIPGTQDDGFVAGSLARIDKVKIGGAFTGYPGSTTTFFYIQAPYVKAVSIGKVTYTHDQFVSPLSFTAIGKATILTL